MSRIRGIEARIPKETLQARNGRYEGPKRTTEDQTKSKDEIERLQISELLQKLPKLDKIFQVHKKIGEGTFSSVYLGSLRQHACLSNAQKKWFAIKHLVPTAHPARIEHELQCLQDMGGKNHVIGVELCLRHLDTIVFIMPYIPHRKFSEYVGEMDAAELQRYMRALLAALRHVHSFGVIHRDVKPSNFLYDRENQRYLLVDFGLAQRICPAPEEPPAHGSGDRKRAREEDEAAPEAKRVALDLSVGARADAPRDHGASEPALQPLTVKAACACAGAGGVCAACARRGGARAARAGTQGFRPPEVLLKVSRQGTGVDVWAAGVVLASALTTRYPFFRAADDAAALAELADLLGTAPLQRAAAQLGRRVVTSSVRRGLCLRKLCARLRGAGPAPGPGRGPGPGTAPPPGPPPAPGPAPPPCAACRLPPARCLCRDETIDAEQAAPGRWTCGFPDAAFALAARLLQPLPAARPSAAAALQHAFLADPLPPASDDTHEVENKLAFK